MLLQSNYWLVLFLMMECKAFPFPFCVNFHDEILWILKLCLLSLLKQESLFQHKEWNSIGTDWAWASKVKVRNPSRKKKKKKPFKSYIWMKRTYVFNFAIENEEQMDRSRPASRCRRCSNRGCCEFQNRNCVYNKVIFVSTNVCVIILKASSWTQLFFGNGCCAIVLVII